MKLLSLTLALLFVAFPTQGRAQATDTAAAIAEAETAALSWLDMLDAGDFGQSWDSAAAAFKSAVTKAQWEQAARSARAPFEPLGARTVRSAAFHTDLPNAPPGRYVVLQFETAARDGQTVIETVTPMQDPDGRWRVSGYYIAPG